MTLAVMIVMVIGGGVIQSVIPAAPLLGEARVPFLAGIVIYYALMRERNSMLMVSVLAGVMQDGLGMMPLGYSSFCFVLIGFAVAQFKDIVFRESLLTTSVFGFITAACLTAGINLLLTKSGLIDVPAGRVFLKVFGSAILGSMSAPIAFAINLGLDRIVGNLPQRKEQPGDEIYLA